MTEPRRRPYILGLTDAQVHDLWQIKERTGQPITAQVRQAVQRYLADAIQVGQADHSVTDAKGETP
jgi:hypothetical protein